MRQPALEGGLTGSVVQMVYSAGTRNTVGALPFLQGNLLAGGIGIYINAFMP